MKGTPQIVILFVVVIAAILAWYFFLGGKAMLFPEPAGSGVPAGEIKTEATAPVPNPPAATGNIDDTVNAILQDVATDTVVGENDEAAMVGADRQAISDFGQSYGENTF